MIIHLGHYLALSAVIFTIGAAGFLARRNVLISLMSIELMLNAVNLTFIAANRWQTAHPRRVGHRPAGNVTQAAASISPTTVTSSRSS
jgi:NADH:ubiquinone oxidoreductase subunit K